MKKVKACGRSESDTPRDTPQVPCNCGREDEREEQKGTKREPKCLNDAARNLDVAHQGAEGRRPIHKTNSSTTYACVLHRDGTPGGSNSPVTVLANKITKHYRSNYEWRLQD